MKNQLLLSTSPELNKIIILPFCEAAVIIIVSQVKVIDLFSSKRNILISFQDISKFIKTLQIDIYKYLHITYFR